MLRIQTALTKRQIGSRLRPFLLSEKVRFFSRAVTRFQAEQPEPLKDLRTLPRKEYEEVDVPIINPADKYKEQTEELLKFGKYLTTCLPKFIQKFSVVKDELVIYIAPTAVIPVVSFLRDHTTTQFKSLIDITGVDYPSRTFRFDVVYHFLSIRYNSRIRVKTYASEVTPVPSITSLFEGANWYERETYDMYGVFFEGHPDLRRLLTDYGFNGHPLRKDFPTTGYEEVYYDEEKKRVVYRPLELTQAFRNFSVGSSAWEQVGNGTDVTPESFKLPKVEPDPEEEAANKEEPKK